MRVSLLLCECSDTVGSIKLQIQEQMGIACEDQMLGDMLGNAVRDQESVENLPDNILVLQNMCVRVRVRVSSIATC